MMIDSLIKILWMQKVTDIPKRGEWDIIMDEFQPEDAQKFALKIILPLRGLPTHITSTYFCHQCRM